VKLYRVKRTIIRLILADVCFIDTQTKPTRVCWGWNWTRIPRTEKRPTDLILSSAFRTLWKKRTAKLQATHLIKHKVGRFNRFNFAFSISVHIKASFLPKDQNEYKCQDEKYWDGNQQGRHCAGKVPSHLAYNHGTWFRPPVKQSLALISDEFSQNMWSISEYIQVNGETRIENASALTF